MFIKYMEFTKIAKILIRTHNNYVLLERNYIGKQLGAVDKQIT